MVWVLGYAVIMFATIYIGARCLVTIYGGPRAARYKKEEGWITSLSFAMGLFWPIALVAGGSYWLLVRPVVNRMEDEEIVEKLDGGLQTSDTYTPNGRWS